MVPRSVRRVPNETMQQTGRGVIALHVGAGSGEERGRSLCTRAAHRLVREVFSNERPVRLAQFEDVRGQKGAFPQCFPQSCCWGRRGDIILLCGALYSSSGVSVFVSGHQGNRLLFTKKVSFVPLRCKSIKSIMAGFHLAATVSGSRYCARWLRVKAPWEPRIERRHYKNEKKGTWCNLGEDIQTQNFNIYKMNEVITQTQKYSSFLQLNKQAVLRRKQGPEHCLKLERWQGPPHINKVKTVWNCVVL